MAFLAYVLRLVLKGSCVEGRGGGKGEEGEVYVGPIPPLVTTKS